MPITLEQLARVARCSKATASKALRDDRRVAAETRRRVQRAAREMNYDIRLARRGRPSSAQAVMRIGLIACAPDRAGIMHDANFVRFLDGAERQAAASHVELLIEIVPTGVPRCVIERRVDALLLYGEQAAALVDALDDLPAVLCTERLPGVAVTQVIKDNRDGAELATRHLLGLGHERIVFVTHSHRKQWALERARGYDAAMRDAGHTPVRVTAAAGADEAADSLIEAALKHRATAIVAGNDAMARRLIRRLERRRVRVPRDVSVVGFDHAPTPDWDGPALTTVDARVAQVAQEAVQLLEVRGRRRRREPITVVVPPRLIEGETTARR